MTMASEQKVSLYKWVIGGYVALRLIHTAGTVVLAQQGYVRTPLVPATPIKATIPSKRTVKVTKK